MKLSFKNMLLFSVPIFLTYHHLAFAETSSDMRSHFKDEFAFVFGHDYHLNSKQLMYSRYLNKNLALGIKIGEGHDKDEDQTSLSVQAKIFKGDSFYISPEFFYINSYEDSMDEKVERKTFLGIGLRLGNQFHYDNLSFGVDWIGIGKGIIVKTNDHNAPPYTITILNTYLGFSF